MHLQKMSNPGNKCTGTETSCYKKMWSIWVTFIKGLSKMSSARSEYCIPNIEFEKQICHSQSVEKAVILIREASFDVSGEVKKHR